MTRELVALRSDGGRFVAAICPTVVETLSGPFTLVALCDVGAGLVSHPRPDRASRLLALQRASSRAILDARTPAELYGHLSEAIVADGEFALAWVALVTGPTVALSAAAGVPLPSIAASTSLDGADAIARAIVEQRVLVLDARATRFVSWPAPAVPDAVRSVCVLPIVRGEEPVGGLGIWACCEDSFDEECLGVLRQVGANVSSKLERWTRSTLKGELNAVRAEVWESDDMATTLRSVAARLARTLRVEACQLEARFQGERLRVRVATCSCAESPSKAVVAEPFSPNTEADCPAMSCDHCSVARVIARATLPGGAGRRGEILLKSAARGALSCDERCFLEDVASLLATVIDREGSRTTLQHVAHHDQLTALPNRNLMLRRLAQFAEQRGWTSGVAVLSVDLDRFSFINDAFGHASGDRVLQELANRLTRTVGPRHLVARTGGDEFGVLCDGLDADEVAGLARDIALQVAQPIELECGCVVPTASIGAAIAGPDSGPEELLRQADAARHHAKAKGRDHHIFFDGSIHAEALRRLELETDLRRALVADELSVQYQPIYTFDGSPVAVEALARWRHPVRGLVPPDEFVAIAEDTGLIFDLGARVLDRVCAHMSGWAHTPGLCDMRVSVNLSAVQLADASLPVTIDRTLTRFGVSPERLQVEITETALMTNAETVTSAVIQLREIGISVAIDDFGTGYSSLGYLRSFPIDAVKIDRCFVEDINANRADAAIVRSVVELAHALNLLTVAEGVETQDQAEVLQSFGCDLGQGYLWSPPLWASEMVPVLRGPLPRQRDPSPLRAS